MGKSKSVRTKPSHPLSVKVNEVFELMDKLGLFFESTGTRGFQVSDIHSEDDNNTWDIVEEEDKRPVHSIPSTFEYFLRQDRESKE